jgi:hypothetical protein
VKKSSHNIEALSISLERTVFATADVPSRKKMCKVSASSDAHGILHVAPKNRVYIVHFAE